MKRVILFVCIGNAYRSQMAEGFFNYHNRNSEYMAASAGVVANFDKVPLDATQLMCERGIGISHHTVKRLTPDMAGAAHHIYDMCGLVTAENFGIPAMVVTGMIVDDPNFSSLAQQREIRDTIEKKVLDIIAGL